MEKKNPTKQILQLQHTEVIRATSSVFSNFSSFHRRFFGVARTMHWCPWKHAGFAPHHHGAAENHARGSSRLGAFAATSNLTSFFDQGCIWLWPHQTKASCSVPPTQTTETIRLSRRLLSWRKKHKLYKSHIGLHRFDPWTKSKDGQFSHFVLLEMWKHYLEALRKFTFSNYLIGAKKPDPSTGTLLNSTICHVSPSLQYMGRTITAKDVLLGEFPGIVLGAIETENIFFVRLRMLEMEKAEEFHSWWTTTNKEKIVPAALAGRSPTWWLAETAQRLRCWHWKK